MRLSVVIPTRDKRPLLARTLAALGAQAGLGDDWEIVVVDDGSRDGTADDLRALAAAPGARLRVLGGGAGTGRAAARERGWRSATGRWVLFLDDDIVAPPGLLAAHLALLESRPGHGTIGRVVTEPSLADAPHFRYLDTRGVAKIASGAVPARYFVTQNTAVPREALVAAGGFDARFRAWGMEDMDLGFRLEERAGLRFLPLRDPVPVHAHHHTLAELLAKKRECGASSLPLLAALHPGRLREMGLDWVVEPPGAPPPRWPRRWARAAAAGRPAGWLEALLARWPGRGADPLAAGLYCRLMDALMLCAYRQGLVQGGGSS